MAPSFLYHLTFDHLVPSILEGGLIPNHTPTAWVLKGAVERSRGRLFLCRKRRVAGWRQTMSEGWVDWPEAAKKLVVLKVDVRGAAVRPDSAPDEDYSGDFWTKRIIQPHRIRVVRTAV